MIWWPLPWIREGRRVISVVIGTHDSEVMLVTTLAALVPGAVAGVVREVIVADGGSMDETERVADVAGCRFIASPEPLGARLSAAAATARADWLLFLQPGSVLGSRWIDEVQRFMHKTARDGSPARAAVFRPRHSGSRMGAMLNQLASALGARPRPDQGLLIAKPHYDAIGRHHADRTDPEVDLLRRVGRRRIEILRSRAGMLGD
jgi:hypothetical protein